MVTREQSSYGVVMLFILNLFVCCVFMTLHWRQSRRQTVSRPSHLSSCGRDISVTPPQNLFIFGSNIHQGSRMNWTDFGGRRSMAVLALWTQYLQSVSRESLQILHKCPPILKDKLIRFWWSKVKGQGRSDCREHFIALAQDVTQWIMTKSHTNGEYFMLLFQTWCCVIRICSLDEFKCLKETYMSSLNIDIG